MYLLLCLYVWSCIQSKEEIRVFHHWIIYILKTHLLVNKKVEVLFYFLFCIVVFVGISFLLLFLFVFYFAFSVLHNGCLMFKK
jgi:hypothetical protein